MSDYLDRITGFDLQNADIQSVGPTIPAAKFPPHQLFGLTDYTFGRAPA